MSELREARNRWAHQSSFSTEDAQRILDSTHRLLSAISSPKEAAEADKLRNELLRRRFNEQARQERRRSGQTALKIGATSTLPAWREVVDPHPDVASGRYNQAEFAADLWQVYKGEGTNEYRNPEEFFRRTYLTESLRGMLTGAVRRVTSGGGDPVIQLQTNFGGGKTPLDAGPLPSLLRHPDHPPRRGGRAHGRGQGLGAAHREPCRASRQQDLARATGPEARRHGGPHTVGRTGLAARWPGRLCENRRRRRKGNQPWRRHSRPCSTTSARA